MVRKIGLISALLLMGLTAACDSSVTPPKSSSNVSKLTVKVPTNQNNNTIEQENIAGRLRMDNKPGSIKHFYIISPRSGKILFYNTVKGKVTSSGKRLSPKTVAAIDGEGVGDEHQGFRAQFGDVVKRTPEILEDDGTYGDSVEYIYWFDVRGVYHQHFFTGGQILHLSDQPLRVNPNEIVINLEQG